MTVDFDYLRDRAEHLADWSVFVEIIDALRDVDASGGGGTVTSEQIDDRVAALLQPGAGVTLTYDDTANTLTVASSGGTNYWDFSTETLTPSAAPLSDFAVVVDAGATNANTSFEAYFDPGGYGSFDVSTSLDDTDPYGNDKAKILVEGQNADFYRVQTTVQLAGRQIVETLHTTDGLTYSGLNVATPDAALSTSEFGVWLDDTPDATRLVVKAKDSDGTLISFGFPGPADSSVVSQIRQVAHGFTVGNVVRLTNVSGTYAKAQANSAANAEVVGIVSAVADADHFTLTTEGRITGLPTVTVGAAYFLSPTTAGAMTTTEPSTVGQISKPVLVADDSTSGYHFNMRGIAISAPSTLGVRTTVTKTTASLADGAREQGTVTMGKTWMVFKLVADRACRVRLYSSTTAQAADATRGQGVTPTGDAACLLDVVIPSGALTFHTIPSIVGTDDDVSATSAIPITIDNLSGSTSTVQVVLSYSVLES